MFVLRHDGREGAGTHGRTLAEVLDLVHLVIEAGRSTQSTLPGRRSMTYGALYVWPALNEGIESSRPAVA